MELTVLERELENRTPDEQDRLAAFLAILRAKRNPAYLRELSHRLDSSGDWIGLSDLKAKVRGDQEVD